MPLIIRIAFALAVSEGLRTRERPFTAPNVDGGDSTNEAYTFSEFVLEFGRTYVTSSEEYAHRGSIFQESLLQIHADNSRHGRSWTAGVHPFMDWTGVERAQRLHGYEPRSSRRWETSETLVALQMDADSTLDERQYGNTDDSFEADAPAVHNQGGLCGSCWAFAAVGAVEAQLMKASSPWPRKHLGEPKLSVQALLDCVQNPRHCGGTGGCDGGTPELAFDFMRDHGVPLATDLSYHPLLTTDKCPVDPYPSDWQRVTLASWRSLPRNQARPMMQALVKEGPVVVAADARDWYNYKSGIFDGCGQDAIPNHSVMARGYGAAGGKKYWLIQNSWGTKWGESGLIRLVRHDDEDSWCGIDTKPQEGVGCDADAHKNFTVCGTCGILFDAVVPQIGQVVIGQPADLIAPASARSTGEREDEVVAEQARPEADEPAAGADAESLPLTPTDAPTDLRTSSEVSHVELVAQRFELANAGGVPSPPSPSSLSSGATFPFTANWRDPFANVYESSEGAPVTDASPALTSAVSRAEGRQPQADVSRAFSSDAFASDEAALFPQRGFFPSGYADIQEKIQERIQASEATGEMDAYLRR